jgi:peptidyl-prolyl cis-trans isomerase C
VNRRRAAAALALLASVACGRCVSRPPQPKAVAPRAVATVNGEPITVEALKRELDQARAAGAEGASPDVVLRRRLLEDAVDRALLLQEARARSIAVGQDQVERALLRVRADYPGSHFDDLLAQEKLSQGELKARMKEQLTVEKLFAEEVFPRVQVTEADVERYYADHPEEFLQPEQVRVSQIVVKTNEEAVKLRAELKRRPRAFAELAKRSSLSPDGQSGGDVGWFGKGSGMPEVFDVCFRLATNALSDVVASHYCFHLFKVTARRPARSRPLDEVRPLVFDKLLRERRAEAQEHYLVALRGKATIAIDERALGAVAP